MLEKLLVGYLAKDLTVAVMAGMTQPTDIMQRQVNACQVFTNFYEWFKNILVDPNWPAPQINPALLSMAIAGGLQPTSHTPPPVGTPPVTTGDTTAVPIALPGTTTTPVPTAPPAAAKAYCRSGPHAQDQAIQEAADFLEELMKISPANPCHQPRKMPRAKP